jgi:hypothetical protein
MQKKNGMKHSYFMQPNFLKESMEKSTFSEKSRGEGGERGSEERSKNIVVIRFLYFNNKFHHHTQ